MPRHLKNWRINGGSLGNLSGETEDGHDILRVGLINCGSFGNLSGATEECHDILRIGE